MTLEDYRKEYKARDKDLSRILLTELSEWANKTIFPELNKMTPEERKKRRLMKLN